MGGLPEKLPILTDETTKGSQYFERVGHTLSEADYDRLIADHLDILESILKGAAIIQQSSHLELLAPIEPKIMNVDLLVGEFEKDDLVRLVLIEDKLIKNPESRRKVLSQILDYAHDFAQVDAEELLDDLQPGRIDRNQGLVDLERILETEDFLLLICGDEIDPDLVDFVAHFLKREDDPRNRVEIAFISFMLYKNKSSDQRLLVPFLAGMVLHRERDLVVKVTVVNDRGEDLRSETEVDWNREGSSQTGTPTAEEFFEWKWPHHGSEVQSMWSETLNRVRMQSGLHLTELSSRKTGSPGVYLNFTERVNRIHVFSAEKLVETLVMRTEFSHQATRYPKGSPGDRAIKRFCQALASGYPDVIQRNPDIILVPAGSVAVKPEILAAALGTLSRDLEGA
ncbi:MAG TPA: hypothetical protein VJN63_05765 [Thermoplasmata archaeon]|nr:hypothetical protein [Thermoplasmata archaeon]